MQSESMKMMKSIFSKVMWVGKATVFCAGLAVTLALMLGVATEALAAVPGDPFKLGRTNTIDRISSLVGSVNNAMLRIDNDSSDANATALELRVEPGKAPMKVNSDARVENLNADQLDGHDAECPEGTRFFLGACWEETRRPQTSISTQPNAMSDCTDEGRYLPHAMESRAYAQQFRGFTDANVLEWTQTVFSEDGLGLSGIAVSRAGGTAIEDYQALHHYRCVAPLVR